MTPNPPFFAIAIAILDSVTVSIAEDKKGSFSWIVWDKDNGDNDSPGGEILADAKVSKTVYDSKRIGDDFCFEN